MYNVTVNYEKFLHLYFDGEEMIIFDTLSKKKVRLDPVRDNRIGIYLCGPTVYDYGHLGHGRSAVVFDLLRRYLMFKGFKVTFVRNWTDIDDKTIERAEKEGTSVEELTKRFIGIYEEDFRKLGILEPDFSPKPTDCMDDIVSFIQRLFGNGHAYALEDGVYYDIASFAEYGALSGQRLDDLKKGVRVEVSDKKRNPGDFALWKFEKPGEPSWPSPWGKGRPGWHIECSVMSTRYLGERFDIHCGGQDLIFPHHEDEIAQSKGAGYEFARYWMHNGFLNIDNEKMSKSLGNFFTLREVFERFAPLTVRFFLLSAHYRAPLNFSEDSLRQAEAILERYNDFIQRVREAGDSEKSRAENVSSIKSRIEKARELFSEGLDDDLNISRSLASLSELMREVNILLEAGRVSKEGAKEVLDFMQDINSVLGVFTFEREMLPTDIQRLIAERNRAREEKDYRKADEIRDRLKSDGIVLEDTKDGTRWKRI
jgi:cysteinyl-tRNA synthetase